VPPLPAVDRLDEVGQVGLGLVEGPVLLEGHLLALQGPEEALGLGVGVRRQLHPVPMKGTGFSM
jgi:hypothetical protein